MDWCDNCKYNPPDYSSHKPDKPCGDCLAYRYGKKIKPSKFVKIKNRQTNADRIRKMTIEELAEFIGCDPLHDICPNNCNDDWDRPCKVCVLEWLKQESE